MRRIQLRRIGLFGKNEHALSAAAKAIATACARRKAAIATRACNTDLIDLDRFQRRRVRARVAAAHENKSVRAATTTAAAAAADSAASAVSTTAADTSTPEGSDAPVGTCAWCTPGCALSARTAAAATRGDHANVFERRATRCPGCKTNQDRHGGTSSATGFAFRSAAATATAATACTAATIGAFAFGTADHGVACARTSAATAATMRSAGAVGSIPAAKPSQNEVDNRATIATEAAGSINARRAIFAALPDARKRRVVIAEITEAAIGRSVVGTFARAPR